MNHGIRQWCPGFEKARTSTRRSLEHHAQRRVHGRRRTFPASDSGELAMALTVVSELVHVEGQSLSQVSLVDVSERFGGGPAAAVGHGDETERSDVFFFYTSLHVDVYKSRSTNY